MSDLLTKLTSDLNAGTKRILANPNLISTLSKQDLNTLLQQVTAYAPRTEAGATTKTHAISVIEQAIINKDLDVHSAVSSQVAEKIAESTFVFEVHSRQPSFVKKVDSTRFMGVVDSKDKSGIDAERIVVAKRLVDRAELKAITKLWGQFIKSIKAHALPGGMLTLGNGQMLIPIEFLPFVREQLAKYLEEREVLIGELGERWTAIVADAQVKLADLFDASEYPSFDQVRQLYSTDYKYISNAVPENFERMSKEIYDQEKARVIAHCESAGALIHDTLRSRFGDYVVHLTDAVGIDEETGKVKRFQESTLEKMRDFIENFKVLNLTGDVELEGLVNQAQELIEGTDAKSIRTDEEIRARIEKGFENLKKQTSRFVKVKSRRVEIED